MFKIEQWTAVKGISLRLKSYSIAVFCRAWQTFKLRNIKNLYKPTFKELLFSIKRNKRTGHITEWDCDITILGFTWQIQKYQDFMCN
jgi:hypothetical protein